MLKHSILSFDWSNHKDKFGLHFKCTKCKISKRIRWLNNQADIQMNLRTKTTVACIRHCTFVMSLFRTSLLPLILCVCLRRFTLLIDSPRQNEIIGSPFQTMDGTTFLTSTFFFFQPRPVPLIFDTNIQVDGIFVMCNNSCHFNGTTSKLCFLSLLCWN